MQMMFGYLFADLGVKISYLLGPEQNLRKNKRVRVVVLVCLFSL